MTDDKTALDALNRLENDALSGRDGYGDARKDAEIIRNFINTRPQPSGDAVKGLVEKKNLLGTIFSLMGTMKYIYEQAKANQNGALKVIEINARNALEKCKKDGQDFAALTQPKLDNYYSAECIHGIHPDQCVTCTPKADVEGLKDMIGEATSIFEHIVDDLRDNQDLSHKDFRIKVSEMAHDYLSQNHIRHLAAQGYIGGGEWQPIETAPNTALVLNKYGEIYHGLRGDNGRWSAPGPRGGGDYYLSYELTHWMPLPAAPKKED